MDKFYFDSTSLESDLSLSVIICTKNRPGDFQECVESLFIQSCLPDEIIVVDCSNNLDTFSIFKFFEKKREVSMKYTHTKPGLTKQRNIGIGMSHGDILAFLDDDVVLEREYFCEILKCFKMMPEIAGVGGKLINTGQGNLLRKYFKKFFLLTSNDGDRGFVKRSGFANFPSGPNMRNIKSTEILSGCNCCFRKSVFDMYSFDEYFDGFGLMEDVDFSYRVSRSNRLVFTPGARLVHKRSEVDRINFTKSFNMNVFNHFYVFRKNGPRKRLDWLFFWWSHIGVALLAFYWTLRLKNFQPLRGVWMGHVKILQSLLLK